MQIDYPVSILYRAVPNMDGLQPAAEVRLFNGKRTTNAVANFESGSPLTVFSPEYAQLIGIEDVNSGNRTGVNTLAGVREIYLFDLEIQLREGGQRFAAQIGFFSGHAARNILGRGVIFAAFESGSVKVLKASISVPRAKEDGGLASSDRRHKF